MTHRSLRTLAGLLLASTSACSDVLVAPEGGEGPQGQGISRVTLPYPQNIQIYSPNFQRPGIVAVTPGSNILYLNFDGAPLRSGNCSDAPTNCTFIANINADFPAFSGSAQARATIVSEVQRYFARYDVQIVTQRPASGPYTMCMIGGRPENIGMQAGAAGVAPLDCSDTNGSDIVFAFSEVTQNDAAAIATTVAQEAAHAYGLGHTDQQADIMYPYLNNATTGFLDQDMPTPDNSFCPGITRQNSHREMLRMLGAATGGGAGAGGTAGGGAGAGGTGGGTAPDSPPQVGFGSPSNNASVGSEFMIAINASDDRQIMYVDVYLDRGTPNEQTARLQAAPYNARVTNLSPGTHTLDAVATDSASQQSSARVTINVGGPAGGGGSPGGEAGAGGSDPGPGTGTGGSDPGPGTGTGTGGTGGGGAAPPLPPPTGGAGGSEPSGPASEPGGMGASCMGPADCSSGLCLADRSTSRQYCSVDCSNDACPTGSVCMPIENVKACVQMAQSGTGNGSGPATGEQKLVGNCAAAPLGGRGDRSGLAFALLPLLALVAARRRR